MNIWTLIRRAYLRWRGPSFAPVTDPEMDRWGVRLSMGHGVPNGQTIEVPIRVDTTQLTQGLGRFSDSIIEAQDAYLALPPAAREHLGPVTLTLGADLPPGPSVGPPDGPVT